jgi:hypothetical protein
LPPSCSFFVCGNTKKKGKRTQKLYSYHILKQYKSVTISLCTPFSLSIITALSQKMVLLVILQSTPIVAGQCGEFKEFALKNIHLVGKFVDMKLTTGHF